jgi:hypothetical protein
MFTIVYYDLACKSCKIIQTNLTAPVWSEEKRYRMSRSELIEFMGNFTDRQCENCGSVGQWQVFKISASGHYEVKDQFVIQFFKDNYEMTGKPRDGNYSGYDFEISYSAIYAKMIEWKNQSRFPSSAEHGEVFIVVDLLKNEPWVNVPVFEIVGFDCSDLTLCMDAIREQSLAIQKTGRTGSIRASLAL